MTVVLGIDPGSRITGYGVVACDGPDTRWIASGVIKLGDGAMPDRLRDIHLGIGDLIETHRPDEFAIEDVFISKNAMSALKLGQARGAAITAAAVAGLPVSEYAARKVKQALAGSGAADKTQVQHMVQRLLNLKQILKADEADALAVALCHAHSRKTAALLSADYSRGSWR